MYKIPSVGRNDPCPCGSGLKYKKCCLGKDLSEVQIITKPTYFDLEIDWDGDFFDLNKAVAYKGKIGSQRKNFCEMYLKQKQAKFEEIRKDLCTKAKNKNRTITCEKGCSACCSLYQESTIQECEVIVHYLMHNEKAYANFLNKYPKWRKSIKEGGDIFKRAEQHWKNFGTASSQVRDIAQFLELRKRGSESDELIRKDYEKQLIPCPFLDNQLCSIYEVRPYVCAGHAVLTPKEWCDPLSPMHIRIIELQSMPLEIMEEREFYYKNLGGPVFSFTPLVVYEILKGGFSYLSRLPGFTLLDEKVSRDPEINSICALYGKHLPMSKNITNI